MNRRPNRSGGGFSLIELLVVILIISLLLTLGAAGLRGMGAGKGVTAAVVSGEALFDEARSTAIGNGTTARVIIDANDPNDTDNYLRRMFIAYKQIDKDGQPTENWVLSSRATILPEKVFFSQSLSKLDQKTGDGSIKSFTLSTEKSALNGTYLYYEFNSQGICTSPGASFIVGTGARNTGEAPRVTGEGKRDFAGFVVWRNGHTSLFRDAKQMDLPDQITTF
jgi:prepilin-type N-terminal cleavage/methylation domain-containing protein